MRLERLSAIGDHLLYLVIAATVLSLLDPGPGARLQNLVMPVLALMVLCVSLTIRYEDLKAALSRPLVLAANLFLSFGLMPLLGLFLGQAFFGPGTRLATGQLLVASLPADAASPFMVYLAGGNTAMACAALTASFAATPLLLPLLLTGLGHVHLLIPLPYLLADLFLVIVIPVSAGVFLNSRYQALRGFEPVYSALSSLSYLLLLTVVVSGNAAAIKALHARALWIAAAALILNVSGYLLALTSLALVRDKGTVASFLFLTGTREFGIASATAAAMGLPGELTIPAVFYAVVQMVTSPLTARLVRRLQETGDRGWA